MTTFGDNDRLAASVAGLLSKAMLVILSDVEGLYDGHPSLPTSKRISIVPELDDSIFALAQDQKSNTSKGGMASKLRAAEAAVSFGHPTIIAPGRDDTVLDRIMAGEDVGTLFLPPTKAIKGRRRWIGSAAHVEGTLVLDDGAVRAVEQKDSSLLAIGIKKVSGDFGRGAVVSLCDLSGREIARGLTNYPSEQVIKILGLPSEKIAGVLGSSTYEVVVHRDNLVLTT
jgi:glutamate 5-kinase